MSKNAIKLTVSFLVLCAISPLVFAQSNPPLVKVTAIKVIAKKMAPDERGTDVENIYNFVVDYAGQPQTKQSYNLLFYMDGKYVTEFKNVTLPYAFARNFKGQADKPYEIRVDLETADLKIAARQTITINVKHARKREEKRQRK